MKLSELILNKKVLFILSFILIGAFSNCKSRKKPIKYIEEEPVIISVKELYSRSCGNCHKLYKPQKYTAQSWSKILDSMQKRAHLTDKNIKDIYQYILTEKAK